jgi:DNA-binding XRE family transcriptional regulator
MRKYKGIIWSAITRLSIILSDENSKSISNGGIHNIATEEVKILTRILNSRGLKGAKHIIYITDYDFAMLKMYSRYMQQRSLIKQCLTNDGITRTQQAVRSISCYKMLSRLHMPVLQLWDILHGYESSSDDIYALLSSCGTGICQKYVVYPLPDVYAIPDRPVYKTKQERNTVIIKMYLDGAGLRQLENAGFGIKRTAILSILQQAGVYKGAAEGKERHQSGEWRTNRYNKYDSTSNKSNKIANSKRSTSKKLRKVLYDLRCNSALTQQQIADLLGCSKAYYCNVENGRETPTEAFWNKIIALFSLTKDYEYVSKISTVRQNTKSKRVTNQVDKDNEVNDYDNMWGKYERPFL